MQGKPRKKELIRQADNAITNNDPIMSHNWGNGKWKTSVEKKETTPSNFVGRVATRPDICSKVEFDLS
jgi:hypothetical protein